MAHPLDYDVFPINTVVRRRTTGEFAIIRKRVFLREDKFFLHYLGEIENKEGLYCLIHDEVELEALLPNPH